MALLFTLVLTTVATTLTQPFIAEYMTKNFENGSLDILINEIHGKNSSIGTQLSISSVPSTHLIYVLIALNIGFFFIAGLGGIIENITVQYVTLKDSIHAYGTQKMFASIGAASISFIVGVIIDGNFLRTLSQYSTIFFVDVILSLSFLVAFYIIVKVISQDHKDLHTMETVSFESNETCKKNIIGSTMTDASTDIVGALDVESNKDSASSTMSNIDGDIVECAAQSSNDNPSSIKGTEYIASQDTSGPSIMPDSSTEHAKTSNMKSSKNIFMELRQAKVYMFFIMLLTEGIAKGVDVGTFMLHLRYLNTSNTVMGLAKAVQHISTMALFPFSSSLIIKCGGKLNAICISCATNVVRFLLLAGIKNPWHILLLQCLQCITGALFWVAVVEYTREISSTFTGNRMFSFSNAIYKHASRAFGVFVGGILLDIYGSPKTYLYFGLIYILVLFMHIIITIHLKKFEKNSSESNVNKK